MLMKIAGRLALTSLALLLITPRLVFSADTDKGPPALVAPVSVASQPATPDYFAFQLGAPSTGGNLLYLPSSAVEPDRMRTKFRYELPPRLPGGVDNTGPGFVLQRSEYDGRGFDLLAEMGDIRINETLNTAREASGRGGRLSLLTGYSGNAARFDTFAATGAHGSAPDDVLVGATGEISIMGESARFKTIFLSGRELLDTEGRWPDSGSRKGDVLGFLAVIDPFKGKLAAEAEMNYSVFDRDTADDASAERDKACRVKVGGEWGRSRYTALYERTGPQYRLMADQGPVRDSQGVALGLETGFELHTFDVKLSRYNDNTEKSELYPRLNRTEGFIDYRFKGFKDLPLGLQYRKTFIDSTREPLGFLAKDVEEDAIFARINYLAGKWDLGLRGGLSQRTDRLLDQRAATISTLGFLPKFNAGNVTLVPDFYLKRTKEFSTDLRTDHYAVNLGINGTLSEMLDYEVKGGFKKEITDLPGTGKQTVGAKVKAAYPLARFFKTAAGPSLGVRGEYKEINNRAYDRRDSDFSLLISLEGGVFL